MVYLHHHSGSLDHHVSDKELVERACSGDSIAFETIVRRYNQALFRAAYSIIADRVMAQDLLQEAYLKAFTHLETFKHQASLKTWLTRIVINTALNAKNAQKTSIIPLDDTVIDLIQHNEVDMTSKLHNSSSQEPDYLADQEQIKHLLQSAIHQLPDNYRSVFILREIENFSVAETALCLDVSQDVIKTRLLRARAMLREKLSSRLEPYIQDLFEFAGKRCDAVTENVLTELHKRGYLITQN